MGAKEPSPSFRQIVERSPDIVVRYDRDLRHLFISPSVEAATGFPPEHYLGRTNRELEAPPELCDYWDRELGAVFDTGEPRMLEFELETVLGRRWFEALVVPERSDDGSVDAVLSFTRDRTEARAAEERYRELVERSPDAIIITELDGRFLAVNPAAERITGFTRAELLERTLWDLVVPADRDRAHDEIVARVADRMEGKLELELVGKDDRRCFVEVRGRIVGTGDDRTLEGFVRETTERHVAEEQLRHQAMHDQLTGLPNRVLFFDRLDQLLRRATRASSQVAVLLLDLDDFKQVNDTLGHPAGDELLVEVARRLSAVVRGGETVARLGGDEFGMVAEGRSLGTDGAAIVRRVQSAFSEPFMLGTANRHITANIGVTLSSDAAETAADLLRDADAAMYRAKRRGAGGYEFFNCEIRDEVTRRARVTEALERALAEQRLQVVYQPIVAIGDGSALAVEALARWTDPELGEVAPTEFIAVAEERGLIDELGRQIRDTALAQLADWRAKNTSILPLGLFVNVSPRELRQPTFAVDLREHLERHGLGVTDVALELTERSVIAERDHATRATIDELVGAGVRLVMDDFGSGYSALSSLKRFPFAALKIDRQFIASITSRDASAPITKAIVGLGKALQVMVVAEGVENETQLDYVRRLGCDAAQGYGPGRPDRPEAVQAWLGLERPTPAASVMADDGGGAVPPPIGADEPRRLAALRRYRVLDTPPEPEFTELARLAAQICETPLAFVSLVDADREFFKAAVGSSARESPRDISFCGHAIHNDGVYVVRNALEHPTFAANPHVVGDSKIRFYAGAPIVTPDGYVVGELCVKDTRPRRLSRKHLSALSTLAHQVGAQLELRLHRNDADGAAVHDDVGAAD